jgi:hypothetical protein
MKNLFNLSLISGLTVAIATITSINKASLAQNNKYFCAQLNQEYHTFMGTNRGNLPLITWIYNYGNLSQRERCIIISRRFERLHDHGLLNHIVTGIVNNQGVLCGVRSQNDTCNHTNVLVTLPPNIPTAQRYQYSRQFLDTRALARGQTVRLNETRLETFSNRENYYNMIVLEELLEIQFQNQFIDQENIIPVDE